MSGYFTEDDLKMLAENSTPSFDNTSGKSHGHKHKEEGVNTTTTHKPKTKHPFSKTLAKASDMPTK